MSSRELLIQTIGPAVAFLRSESARAELRTHDVDLARRRLVEQLTGVSESGDPIPEHSDLEHGQHDSIPRVLQVQANLRDLVTQLKEHPERFNVNVARYE